MTAQYKLIQQVASAIDRILSQMRTDDSLIAIGEEKGAVSYFRIDGSKTAVYNHQLVVPTDDGSTAVLMFDAWANHFQFNLVFRALDSKAFVCSEVYWSSEGQPTGHIDYPDTSLETVLTSKISDMLTLASENAGLSNSVNIK